MAVAFTYGEVAKPTAILPRTATADNFFAHPEHGDGIVRLEIPVRPENLIRT